MTTVAVVVHHFSESVIERCVSALRSQTLRCEVLVVANSEVEGSLRRRLEAAGAQVHQLPENVGFARACNAGARLAEHADLLWFVNPDVTCSPDCHAVLASRTPTGAASGPAITDDFGTVERSVKSRDYVTARVLLLRELMVGRIAHLGSPDPPTSEASVVALSGACLLVHRTDFLSIGGFDESFFLYGEDVDLSLRLAGAGVDVRYVPTARAEHAAGTGAGGRHPSADVLVIKGREARRAHERLLRIHSSPASARRYRAGLRVVLPLRIGAGLLRGATGAVARDRAALAWLRHGSRRLSS